MKLSVIIPFYNELDLINRAVNSVVANSNFLIQIEIILINDGTIKEIEIRSRFSDEINKIVKIVPNNYTKGPGGARNTGLEILNGEIIAFLDADDFWLSGKLDAQICEIKTRRYISTPWNWHFNSNIN